MASSRELGGFGVLEDHMPVVTSAFHVEGSQHRLAQEATHRNKKPAFL
jgi:hypothetical protein